MVYLSLTLYITSHIYHSEAGVIIKNCSYISFISEKYLIYRNELLFAYI